MSPAREGDYEAAEMSNVTAFNVSTNFVNQSDFYTSDYFIFSRIVEQFLYLYLLANVMCMLVMPLLALCYFVFIEEEKVLC